MRRVLSVLLSLLFCLEPIANLFPGSSESRLPACCRRHGAHHCAMSAHVMAIRSQWVFGSAPFLTAPSRCPLFPASNALPASTTLALSIYPSALPVPVAQFLGYPASRAAVRLNHIRTHTGRAPPANSLA